MGLLYFVRHKKHIFIFLVYQWYKSCGGQSVQNKCARKMCILFTVAIKVLHSCLVIPVKNIMLEPHAGTVLCLNMFPFSFHYCLCNNQHRMQNSRVHNNLDNRIINNGIKNKRYLSLKCQKLKVTFLRSYVRKGTQSNKKNPLFPINVFYVFFANTECNLFSLFLSCLDSLSSR